MNITISTDERKFFKQLVDLMSSFSPLRNIRRREKLLDLVATIMHHNYEYKTIPKEKRDFILFSRNNRKDMAKQTGLTESGFNNALSDLRKHNIITQDNHLSKFLDVIPNENYTFTINFKLSKNE